MTTPSVYRCRFCEALFESDAADAPRCPQCGLTGAEPAVAREDEPVLCDSAWFQ